MKRGGRLSPTSKKRLAELSERPAIRQAVFERDGGCVARGWGPCWGIFTVHHLRKASQGGTYTMDNLVTLCAHHNTKAEDNPNAAYESRIGEKIVGNLLTSSVQVVQSDLQRRHPCHST